MDELEAAQIACVAIMAAIVVATAWRKRNFVLFATVGMLAIVGVEFLFHPGHGTTAERCYMPGITWRAQLWDQPTEWYRMATSMFLHHACNASHILGNAFTFVLLGFPLEEKIGWKRTMAVFFITGLVGFVLWTGMMLAYNDPALLAAPTFGASGAIFGVIGYFATRYPQEKVLAPILVILMRVPVAVAAVAALAVQSLILLNINNPFIGQLPWPSIAAHVTAFGVGMIITKVPWLEAPETPGDRTFRLDLAPLRDLVEKPADATEVEALIAEDIPEVAQVKLEAFVKRAHCPKCQGALTLKGRKVESDCGWSLTFEKRPLPKKK